MIPTLLIGPPGVGKTASVRASYDFCEVLLLSSMTEEDIAGLPYREGCKERRTMPPFVERLQDARGSKCLFLDELDKARREVADTLLTLITHPETFGIPAGTTIIAAANPPEWGGGDGISDAMLSRFSVINYIPNLSFFVNHIQKKYHLSDNIVDAFIRGEIPLLEVEGEGLSRRLTCPRTLEMAINVMKNNHDKYPKEELVKGLLTANTSSFLLRAFSNEKEEKMSTASRVAIKQISHKPYRP